MRCATTRRLKQLSDSPVILCRAQITVTSVRNLGVTMDTSLSFLSHVNHVVSSSFYQLRRIKCSLKALPFDTAKYLVNCFVISRIDYCNSLLSGVPQYALYRLQRVMNAAARMLCGARKNSHVSGLIRDLLHWLPVSQRIRFKTVSDDVQSDARIGACIIYPNSASSPALKDALGHLLVATWTKFGEHAILSSRVRRHGTSYFAPSATIHPWTVSRRLWKHFCLHLISDCTLHFYCCMLHIFSIGLRFVWRSWIGHCVTAPYKLSWHYYYYYIMISNNSQDQTWPQFSLV